MGGACLAIFHLHVKNISREQGRSIVAAAAYRAGESLMNEAGSVPAGGEMTL